MKSPLLRAASDALHQVDNRKTEDLVCMTERIAKRELGQAVPMPHVRPVMRLFERILRGEQVRAVVSYPVRHGKTTCVKAGVLALLKANPRTRIHYACYGSDLAEGKMFEARKLCGGEGIRLDPDFSTKAEWRTNVGGAVKSGGLIGGPWNGQGAHVGILDDPYKNAEQAYSRAYNESLWEQYHSAFLTRLEPGASSLVFSARWGVNDINGRLLKLGWEEVSLPCLVDGAPLWPERWTLAELLEIKGKNPFWNALYMSNPLPESGMTFDLTNLTYYDKLPDLPYVEAIGIDVAYGRKSTNDRSSYTVFRRYMHDPRVLYRVETWSGREPIELFACRVAQCQIRRGGGPSLTLPKSQAEMGRWLAEVGQVRSSRIMGRWYTSTTEAGAAQLMNGYGAAIEPVRAAVDKLARAQAGGYTAAWAEGRIVVPNRETDQGLIWLKSHQDFTGRDGDEDDPVDGSVAAHDLLALPPAALGSSSGVTLVGPVDVMV